MNNLLSISTIWLIGTSGLLMTWIRQRGRVGGGLSEPLFPMETPSARPHLFGLLAGLFLAAGLCFASVVFTRTWTHLHESQVIDVTGSARKNVQSDLVVWRASFAVEDEALLSAHDQLKADLGKVTAFLHAKGVKDFSL